MKENKLKQELMKFLNGVYKIKVKVKKNVLP